MKLFIADQMMNTVNLVNVLSLFPNLEKYYDFSGQLLFVNDDTVLSNKTIEQKSEDIYSGTKKLFRDGWKCLNCGYKNVKLMINGLWRYYNELNICCMCSYHRYDKDHALLQTSTSKSKNSTMTDESKLTIITTTQEQIVNGFDKDSQCLVDKSEIFQLSADQLSYLLDKYIIKRMTQPLIKKFKDKIISYFKENNISGEKFIEMKKKELKKNLASYCGDRKLPGPLGKLFKEINAFELKTLTDEEHAKSAGMTYRQLLHQCSPMKRANFIVTHFEQLTSQLSNNEKYPYEMKRFLLSLPDYGPVKLLNDIEHIVDHKAIDIMECEQKSEDCIHLKRSRRDENDHLYKDINTKKKAGYALKNFIDRIMVFFLKAPTRNNDAKWVDEVILDPNQ
eukprot:53973_1